MGRDNSDKFSLCKDALFSIDFDSSMRTIYGFEGGLKDWLGEVQGKLNLNAQFGYDGAAQRGRFGTSMSSLTLGLADPFHFGDFTLIKGLYYTLAYTGSIALGGKDTAGVLQGNFNTYGEAAAGNCYGKLEILLGPDKVGEGLFKYANFYWKQNYGADPYNNNIYSAEKDRFGLTLGLADGMVGAELYNSPSYYQGDPYQNGLDLDLSAIYKVWDYDDRKNTTAAINIRAYTTQVMGWLNRGYDMPPIGIGATLTVHSDWLNIFVSAEGTIKGKKVNNGIYDPVPTTQYANSEQWEGISVKTDGSAYQNSKTVNIAGAEKIFTNIDPSNKPKMVINAPGAVDYMKRSLITGQTGESAASGWASGGASPVKIYLKSVKIMDLINNKIYGLNSGGQFVELKGDQPTTAPDLTAANLYFAGGQREFTLPEAIWKSERGDGRMRVSAVVEYGADVSTVDKSAVKQYTVGINPALIWDPNEGINATYTSRVKWQDQWSNGIHYFAHNWDDPNCSGQEPYDPTKPYDPNTNPYWASLKKLAPIPLNVSVVY